MAAVAGGAGSSTFAAPNKWKPKHIKSGRAGKKTRNAAAAAPKRRRPSLRLLKLFEKRAKRYRSDTESEGEEDAGSRKVGFSHHCDEDEVAAAAAAAGSGSSGDEGFDYSGSDGETGDFGDRSGRITKFMGGCRAFRVAFVKIMYQKLSDDPLGPILAGHRKLVAAKLAKEDDEEQQQRAKEDLEKQKHLAKEKGHVKQPSTILDEKERLLIGVATKGVVRLFNAVSETQKHLKGSNTSGSKNAKALGQQRGDAHASGRQTSTQDQSSKSAKIGGEDDEPGWAPLRDSYMLSSELKDWDKIQEVCTGGGHNQISMESSDDNE